jgi:ABC-type branched-subunit amino acid transport system ATPase component
MQYVGLFGVENELAKNLPYGAQRRLEIAVLWRPSHCCCCLMNRRPE